MLMSMGVALLAVVDSAETEQGRNGFSLVMSAFGDSQVLLAVVNGLFVVAATSIWWR